MIRIRGSVLGSEWILPRVGAPLVLIVELRQSIEIVVLKFAADRPRSVRPFLVEAPITDLDRVVDAIVSEVLVLQQKLEGIAISVVVQGIPVVLITGLR